VADVPVLTIYSRPGCHLCDDMKDVIARVARTRRLIVEDVDISGNQDLEARYGLEIPVLLVDGRKAAKYKTSEHDLERILNSRRP